MPFPVKTSREISIKYDTRIWKPTLDRSSFEGRKLEGKRSKSLVGDAQKVLFG
jgi:hypothetical protein